MNLLTHFKKTWRFIRLRMLFALVGILQLVATAHQASAWSPTTHGDATAVLEAFGNGGWAVLLHSGAVQAAPAQGLPGPVAIRPFSGTPFDGAHYCALDWHTIAIAFFDEGPRQHAADWIAGLSVQFILDGAPLEATQTAIKRFLNPERFGLTDAYYSQFARVMAPSDLAPGSHILNVVFTDVDGTSMDGITFFVDPPGTGVCQ